VPRESTEENAEGQQVAEATRSRSTCRRRVSASAGRLAVTCMHTMKADKVHQRALVSRCETTNHPLRQFKRLRPRSRQSTAGPIRTPGRSEDLPTMT
jgi:hypothetical protein